MVKGIRERDFQNKMIEWSIPLGWSYLRGRSLPRGQAQTVVAEHLRDAVQKLNPTVIDNYDVDAVIDEVITIINNVEGGIVTANERVLNILRGGKEFRDKDDQWHVLTFVDLQDPSNNILIVSDEVTISIPGKTSRRFDLVYFVNGLPLVVVEVKSPTSDSSWRSAADEINGVYAAEYPWFFTPNVFCVGTDGVRLRFGAAGAPTNTWQPFRSTADDEGLNGLADVQRSCELLFAPTNLFDILSSFCLFDTSGGGADRKYLPRYPQKEAAHLIHRRVVEGGKNGLIWHHQGSGKTLLMVFAASLLLNDARAESPTIVLLSDRTQIVRQTAGVFVSAMGHAHFHEPATSADLRTLLAEGVAGVISTTIHKFADAGPNLSLRDNVVVMADEAHRTHSASDTSLAGRMRAALPNARFFGMTGTPVRNLHTDTFALFGDPRDPDRVLHRYSMTRSLLDEATVPVILEPHPVGFEMNDRVLQAEFDEFADGQDLDDADREALSRKFGRLTSVFSNPDRISAVCRHIVEHYLGSAYRNGMKAQVVAYNRELAVAYTDSINAILREYESKQVLTSVLGKDGKPRHDVITAEVNISVSESKDEDPRMRPYQLSEVQEEDQKRRFLAPENPLSFLVVTAKLMTGFDAPNEGVLYLDKPLKSHTLFQTITRPNRTWVSPVSGYVKPRGAVVDYIGLANEVQLAVKDPGPRGPSPAGRSFIDNVDDLVAEFRQTFANIEDLLTAAGGLDINSNSYDSVRTISTFLDSDDASATTFKSNYLMLSRVFPYVSGDTRIGRYFDSFALFGSVYVTLFRKSTDAERKERLGELGPMVLDIINSNVHSFEVAASQEESLTLDAQGLRVLRDLMDLVKKRDDVDEVDDKRPTAREILDRVKAALDEGVDEQSVKYVALADRLRDLRERIIRGASDALEFLTEALKIAQTVVDAQKKPDEVLVVDEDHVGVLSRIIADHPPTGLSVTERRLAEEIDQVVRQTLAAPYDNAEARGRALRRAAAAVFRKYRLKPVGEPYDSTVAYAEAHYLVD